MVSLALLAFLLSGCTSMEEQSDWRWKQQNPDYRLPWPQDKAVPGIQF